MDEQTNIGYFHRVSRETPTKFWINNATMEEAQAAITMGAVAATTNPTYPARLLREDPDFINSLIDKTLEKTADDNKVAELVYQQAVSQLQSVFLPLYEQSGGSFGYVAIQGDPRTNHDPESIFEGALRYFQMGKNIIVKVPATPAGAEAMSKLTPMGHPTIATLGLSVDQAIYMAEAYEDAIRNSETRPLFYVTFIAGILEEHLAKESESKGNVVPKEWIHQAGCAATQIAYQIYKEKGYKAILLGGGARGTRHFSKLVGGDLAITIGWDIAHQLVEKDEAVISCINNQTPENIIAALEENLPDFSKAYRPNSLKPEQFCQFSPVVKFQNAFLTGIDTLLKAIAARKDSFKT